MNVDIEDRIWNAIPVTQQAFTKLLELLDIEESNDIATACVTLGNRSRLRINPEFVRKHCQTNDRLAMLVLHELYHILLGHTRQFEKVTPAQNWAFDAMINAHLCRLYPAPTYTVLFRELYKPDVFPEALLRPPDGWGTKEEYWQLEGEALRVHRTLYTEDSATYHELFSLLSNPVLTGNPDGRFPKLLGNHESDEDSGTVPPQVTDEVRDIIARWPMVERVKGRDSGRRAEHQSIELEKASKAVISTVRRALIGLLDHVSGFRGAPGFAETVLPALLPYATGHDRSAWLKDATGQVNLFYQAGLSTYGRAYFEKVHVYVDVSGSMNGVLPHIYAALVPLLEYLDDRIHLFSTEISDIRARRLCKGDVNTTFGTEIDCVTQHVIDEGVRTAVIITDGWVGSIPDRHQRELLKRNVRINTVLTHGGDSKFAEQLKGRTFELCKI